MSNKREQEINNDRVSELQEQNTYLRQKIEILKQKHYRNEHERMNLLERNKELERIKIDLEQQLQTAVSTIKTFVEFKQELEYEEAMWERRSNPKFANLSEGNVK